MPLPPDDEPLVALPGVGRSGSGGAADETACAALPALGDAAGLVAFFSAALRDLEDAQGGAVDEEARGALAQLEAQLARQTAASGSGRTASAAAAPAAAAAAAAADSDADDVDGGSDAGAGDGADAELRLASQLDALEASLAEFQAGFAALPPDARRLVSAGASVWMGGAAHGAAAEAATAAGGSSGGGGSGGGGIATIPEEGDEAVAVAAAADEEPSKSNGNGSGAPGAEGR